MMRVSESQTIITGLFNSFQVIERLGDLPEAYRQEIATEIADKVSRLILLDIKQIKDIIGVSEQVARKLPLPGIRVGCRMKYSLADLVNYVETNKEGYGDQIPNLTEIKKSIERRRDKIIKQHNKL